jgi:hypothetical protein
MRSAGTVPGAFNEGAAFSNQASNAASVPGAASSSPKS